MRMKWGIIAGVLGGIADIRAALQELIDAYNVKAPAYKRIYSLKVRESEFEKTASRKIKRS